MNRVMLKCSKCNEMVPATIYGGVPSDPVCEWCRALPEPSPTAPAKGLEVPPDLGPMLLFGPPLGVKIDPRFPMRVCVVVRHEQTDYLSLQEHEHLLRQARAEAFRELLGNLEAMPKHTDLGSVWNHVKDLMDLSKAAEACGEGK